MAKKPTYRFLSHNTRTVGGVGFKTDNRSVYGDQDPTELRQGDKIHGRGQILDFFEVDTICAHCGELRAVNIVSLCGECAQVAAIGDRRNRGPIGDPALQEIARLHRRGLSTESAVVAALHAMEPDEADRFRHLISRRVYG